MPPRKPFPHDDVVIPSLGHGGVLSSLQMAEEDAWARMRIDVELSEEFETPRNLRFELAGPRRRLYFEPARVKAAIVTCGGLCPGINDVIRSLVRTLCCEYGAARVLGIRRGLRGLMPHYGLGVMDLTPDTVDSIHESGGTILGTSRGPQPAAELADALERLHADMLFVIGGDGTMRAAAALDAELRSRSSRIAIIGIPKTIDNDINFIPRSFGFETAVGRAVEVLRCARTEAMSVQGGIGIVKMMGRESGFIAAHATLAFRDVDFTLVPEAPFRLHGEGGLIRALERRLAVQDYALIVVAEGAGQNLLPHPDACDASGNRQQGDIAALLMREIATEFDVRSVPYYFKYIDPGYMVRSVPAGVNDRMYCALLGQHAAHAAMSGRTGAVVAKIMDRFVHLPLVLVARKRRRMHPGSELWRSVLACTRQTELLWEPDTSKLQDAILNEKLKEECNHGA